MNIALLYPTRERNTTGVRNLTKGCIIETLKRDKKNEYFFLMILILIRTSYHFPT